MSSQNPLHTYEVQWESATGNRRVETIEGDSYESYYEPNPYLRVFVIDGDKEEDVFRVVGFNFTIKRLEDEE